MEHLDELRNIKKEVLQMDFSFQHIHRVIFLAYKTRNLLMGNAPIPNKDIALHQINKVIDNEVHHLLTSELETDIKNNFSQVIDNFKLVLVYVA